MSLILSLISLAVVYKCKEHPNAPEYYDLKGIEESHFKPFHKDPNYSEKDLKFKARRDVVYGACLN